MFAIIPDNIILEILLYLEVPKDLVAFCSSNKHYRKLLAVDLWKNLAGKYPTIMPTNDGLCKLGTIADLMVLPSPRSDYQRFRQLLDEQAYTLSHTTMRTFPHEHLLRVAVETKNIYYFHKLALVGNTTRGSAGTGSAVKQVSRCSWIEGLETLQRIRGDVRLLDTHGNFFSIQVSLEMYQHIKINKFKYLKANYETYLRIVCYHGDLEELNNHKKYITALNAGLLTVATGGRHKNITDYLLALYPHWSMHLVSGGEKETAPLLNYFPSQKDVENFNKKESLVLQATYRNGRLDIIKCFSPKDLQIFLNPKAVAESGFLHILQYLDDLELLEHQMVSIISSVGGERVQKWLSRRFYTK